MDTIYCNGCDKELPDEAGIYDKVNDAIYCQDCYDRLEAEGLSRQE